MLDPDLRPPLVPASVLGLAKTLLLRARILGCQDEARSRRPILAIRDRLPVLRTCPLLNKIVNQWEDWTHGRQISGETDEFWGML